MTLLVVNIYAGPMKAVNSRSALLSSSAQFIRIFRDYITCNDLKSLKICEFFYSPKDLQIYISQWVKNI